MRFRRAYLKTDSSKYQWFGAVIRCIPRNYTHERLTSFLATNENGFMYCLPPTDVGNSKCSIAVLKDRDAAERLCIKLNGKVLEEYYKIKVFSEFILGSFTSQYF
jgi:hypothetical protein